MGFLDGWTSHSSTWCVGSRGFSILVKLRRVGSDVTEIILDASEPGYAVGPVLPKWDPCGIPPARVPPSPIPGDPFGGTRDIRPVAAVVPPLLGPVGATVLPGTIGNGPSQFIGSSVALAPMPPAQLEDYFAAQLAAAGWHRRDGSASDLLAWSTWPVPGEGQWHATLPIRALPAESRYSLLLRGDQERDSR
jgi:hypothetical protein